MKKKEILNLFYEEMNPHFEQWGFKFYKSKLQASLNQNGITKRIFFDANYFLGKGAFQPYLRLREEEIMGIRGGLNARYDNNHFLTISMHLPSVVSLFEREDLNFLFEDLGDHDLGSYVYDKTMPFFKARFVEFMEEVGLKFFEMFYTQKDFDRWFNEGIFEGKYEGGKINQDTVPIYSYISAFITGNQRTEDIFDYWMEYEDLYQGAKEEIVKVREYLTTNYKV